MPITPTTERHSSSKPDLDNNETFLVPSNLHNMEGCRSAYQCDVDMGEREFHISITLGAFLAHTCS